MIYAIPSDCHCAVEEGFHRAPTDALKALESPLSDLFAGPYVGSQKPVQRIRRSREAICGASYRNGMPRMMTTPTGVIVCDGGNIGRGGSGGLCTLRSGMRITVSLSVWHTFLRKARLQ